MDCYYRSINHYSRILGGDPVRYYSNSEFQCFKECRRKWWLGWYRRLKPIIPDFTGAAPLGTTVHKALAPWYVPETQERQDPREVLEGLIRHARTDVIEAYQADPERADGVLREMDADHDYARAMIAGYMQWLEETGADSEFEVIGSEQVVSYEVTPGKTLIGRLDVRVRRIVDGVRLLIDHKTCANFPDLQRSLQQGEQMPTYLILERTNAYLDRERADGAIFNGLRKVKRTGSAKPPFFDRFTKMYNSHELESLWNRIQGTMRMIEETEVRLESGEPTNYVVYPTPTRDCHWKCEFYAVCPMFDDGSRAEDMIAALYQPVEVLDRYPELAGQKEVETG